MEVFLAGGDGQMAGPVEADVGRVVGIPFELGVSPVGSEVELPLCCIRKLPRRALEFILPDESVLGRLLFFG